MVERKRILIVDDEQSILFVLESSLRTLGDQYEIVTAQSGEEALEYARARPLALVIADIVMEPMDGVALTRAIREFAPDVPVIWMAGYSYEDLRDRAAELSVHCCLAKPVEVAQIRQAVREALAASGEGSVQESANRSGHEPSGSL